MINTETLLEENNVDVVSIRYFYTKYTTGTLEKLSLSINTLGNTPCPEWVKNNIRKSNYNCPFTILDLNVEVSKEKFEELMKLPDSYNSN